MLLLNHFGGKISKQTSLLHSTNCVSVTLKKSVRRFFGSVPIAVTFSKVVSVLIFSSCVLVLFLFQQNYLKDSANPFQPVTVVEEGKEVSEFHKAFN